MSFSPGKGDVVSYRIKRIDPFWIAHPGVIAVAVVGVILALIGYNRGNIAIQVVGGVMMGGGVLVATKHAVSAVLGTLGLIGGILTFVILPNPELATTPMGWRLVSTLFFALLYMVLMDALILVVCGLYNFFGSTLNMKVLQLDIEEDEAAAVEGE